MRIPTFALACLAYVHADSQEIGQWKHSQKQLNPQAALNSLKALSTFLLAHDPAVAFSSFKTRGAWCLFVRPTTAGQKRFARCVPIICVDDLVPQPVRVAPSFDPQDVSEYPVYWINLATRADRRTRFEQQLETHGLPATRVEACTGQDVDDSVIDRAWSPKLNSQFDLRQNGDSIHIVHDGERGCAGSHVALWEKCVADNRPIVIMEDDARFAEDFSNRYKKAVEWMAKRDPTFMYFQVYPANWTDFEEEIDSSMIVRGVKYAWLTTGYVIWPETAYTLLNQLPMHEPLDNFIARMALEEVIRVYVCFPYLVTQDGGSGDIPHTAVDEWSDVSTLSEFSEFLNE